MKQKKINKNEFLDMIAKRNNVDVADIRQFYDSFVDGLTEIVCEGQGLSLTGFGTFSLKKHRGHPVQFGTNKEEVTDYMVLKFTASDVLMNKIRADYTAESCESEDGAE